SIMRRLLKSRPLYERDWPSFIAHITSACKNFSGAICPGIEANDWCLGHQLSACRDLLYPIGHVVYDVEGDLTGFFVVRGSRLLFGFDKQVIKFRVGFEDDILSGTERRFPVLEILADHLIIFLA